MPSMASLENFRHSLETNFAVHFFLFPALATAKSVMIEVSLEISSSPFHAHHLYPDLVSYQHLVLTAERLHQLGLLILGAKHRRLVAVFLDDVFHVGLGIGLGSRAGS
jgi:hypothetical protein